LRGRHLKTIWVLVKQAEAILRCKKAELKLCSTRVRHHSSLRSSGQAAQKLNSSTNAGYINHHLATILKFTNRGVKRLGTVKTLLAKSFISK
jgi:hypothetical protein